MRVIALLALCCAAVAAAPPNRERIVGGSATTINQYPEMVALLFSANLAYYWHDCGGTILNNRSILTAATCTFGYTSNRWRARVGSTLSNSGGIVYTLSNIINHSNYSIATSDNDIAILRTSSAIFFNDYVRAASIAGSNYNLADNQVVWATGWGLTSIGGPPSEQLHHVQIWTINQDTCRNRYGLVGWQITDNMLCSGWLDVGGRDQCRQDSGGPLYHNGVVVGVCSLGSGCGSGVFPGINTRVSRYTTWIQANA